VERKIQKFILEFGVNNEFMGASVEIGTQNPAQSGDVGAIIIGSVSSFTELINNYPGNTQQENAFAIVYNESTQQASSYAVKEINGVNQWRDINEFRDADIEWLKTQIELAFKIQAGDWNASTNTPNLITNPLPAMTKKRVGVAGQFQGQYYDVGSFIASVLGNGSDYFELQTGNIIDDTVARLTTTYSSNKIESKLLEKQTQIDDNLNTLNQEITDRQNADSDLQDQLDTTNTNLTNETTARTNADTTLQNNINLKANQSTTYTKTEVDTALSNKVDKIAGKSLSENDFTNDYKTQVDNNTTARHTHSNKALLDTYTQTEVNLADAVSKKHDHSNKTVLDNTTASYTTAEQTKLGGIQAGAEVNVNADWNAVSGDAQILNKPSVYTQTEVDSLLSANSSNDRNRSNHTGTQSSSTINQSTITPSNTVATNGDTQDVLNNKFQGQITNVSNGKSVKTWYISGGVNGSGNDTNNGFKPDNAFLTLSKLNSTIGNTGEQAVFLPTQLSEDITFAQLNAEFTGFNASHRATCGTNGTITSNNGAGGSQTYSYLTLGNFNKTGAGYTMLYDLTINSSFSDNNNGAVDSYNCQFGSTTPISITGAGTKNFYNQRGGIFTINNTNAKVNVITNDYISQFTLTAGLLAVSNAIVYIAQGTTLNIGSTGATFVGENVKFLYPDNTPAKINIPTGVLYSLQNCIFDNANSTLNGVDISSTLPRYYSTLLAKSVNLPSLTASTILATDTNKSIQSLSTATYPSLTELSYVKGGTSSFQTQINTKENSITAGTTSQYYRGDKTFQTLNTTVVAEGTNQYFTNARAIASVLTGFVASATRTAIASTDSILSAFQKCQKYFNDLTTIAFSGSGADLTNNTVSNSKLAQMSANTIKGNNTGSNSNALDLTIAQTKTMLALDQVNNTTDANKPISTATQTALDNKVDFNNAQTLTPTQVRQNARNIDTIPYFTTTQRDGLTGWVANEVIFNTTTNRYEKRKSDNSGWEAMLFGIPAHNDASKILRSLYYTGTTPSSANSEASIDVSSIITRNNVLGWLGFVDDGSSDGYNLPSGGASTHVNKTINAHLQLVNGSSPLKLWIEAPSNTLLISKPFRVVIWHFETVS
jgi:hypothetical protein